MGRFAAGVGARSHTDGALEMARRRRWDVIDETEVGAYLLLQLLGLLFRFAGLLKDQNVISIRDTFTMLKVMLRG